MTDLKARLVKLKGCLEYLQGWQSKDGSAVVVEVAEDALSILTIIEQSLLEEVTTGQLRDFLISNGGTSYMDDARALSKRYIHGIRIIPEKES